MVPRNTVQFVVDGINMFNDAYILRIKEKLREELNLVEQSIDPNNSLTQINRIIDSVSNPFKNLNTEHKRIKYLEENCSYTPPKDFIMGQCSKPKKVQGTIVSMAVDIKGKFITLRSTLKSLLEIPGSLDEIKNYMTKLKSSDE